MGKVVSGKKGSGQIRKSAPAPSGREPAHDRLNFPRGGETVPTDKGWCHKCKGWRFYRGVKRIVLANGERAFQARCVKCGTVHTFHDQRKR